MTFQDQHYVDTNGDLHFLSAEDQANAAAQGLPLPDPSWTPVPPPPGDGYVWNSTSNAWELPLATAKGQQKGLIKAAFENAVAQGFACPSTGIKMDCDRLGILQFDGGVRYEQKTGGTSLDIRDFNNVTHTAVAIADADTMVAELTAHYQSLLGKKWSLEAQIDAATTVADVQALVW